MRALYQQDMAPTETKAELNMKKLLSVINKLFGKNSQNLV